VALVTGADKGIGFEVARAIAFAIEQPSDVDVNES
jgi:NADP-dependent 3-hydroxy acid dehydrogenase YdfG